MKVGLVGFAGSGKTTVFNALTGLHKETGVFADRGRLNIGAIKVPDSRIDRLADIYHPKRKVFTEISFADFVGQPQTEGKGASTLDAKTLAEMREMDALVIVVRDFESPLLAESPDPQRDLVNFTTELILTDLGPVENRLARLKKEAGSAQEKELLERCKSALELETPIRDIGLDREQQRALSGFQFLTAKPALVLINADESKAGAPAGESLARWLEEKRLPFLSLSGKIEAEISELASEEQADFLKDLGISEPARTRFIHEVYLLCDLVSFLTAGEDECRAWTIARGTVAQKAAGRIHSDIERGFIRAEVVAFDDFIKLGSEAKCREAGKLRLEGKEYVVADGDIINFRFNV